MMGLRSFPFTLFCHNLSQAQDERERDTHTHIVLSNKVPDVVAWTHTGLCSLRHGGVNAKGDL